MAFTQKNSFAIGDADIEELMTWADVVAVGGGSVSLTEMSTTTVPAIAAGSWIECGGATYESATETAISTTDPVTGATVADGTIYVVLVPGTSTITAAFTATAPTWNGSYQGWYLTGSYAAYKCIYRLYKSTTSYHSKFKIKQIKSNILQVEYDKVVVVAALAAQTVNNTTAKLNTSPSEVVDTHSAFSSSATFTAPYKGIYRCSALSSSSDATAYIYISFYKNGSRITSELHYWQPPLTVDLSLTYGDTIELYARTASSVSITTELLSFELILPL